ncbi:MAG: hypothetical protein N2109_01880 [Fimbriimonadales bacterium]|nr:hypothetical protein [Fimbriimonadales bacterium]
MRKLSWIVAPIVGLFALAGCGPSAGETPVEEYRVEPGKERPKGPAVNLPPEVRQKLEQGQQGQ